jgi:hypothetical protein
LISVDSSQMQFRLNREPKLGAVYSLRRRDRHEIDEILDPGTLAAIAITAHGRDHFVSHVIREREHAVGRGS